MKKLLLICLLLAGCSAAKKQAREVANMQVYAVRYPGVFKTLANTLDPCFNGVAKSDTVIKHDTTQLSGSTVTNTVFRHDTSFTTKTITLPGKKITITNIIHDTVTNDRKIVMLEGLNAGIGDSLKLVKSQLKKTGDQNTHRLWWLIAIAAAALIFIVIKVYTLFYGGAATGIIKKIL